MNKSQIEELKAIFGESDVLTDVEDMVAYSYDASHAEIRPEAVVFARTTEQVSQLMKFAYRQKICVTPRGQGSGLSGGSVPLQKGIVLSMDKMNKVLDFDPANRLITVEAGLTTSEIDLVAVEANLFYPPDPGSVAFSTIGGNVAENAGGLRGLKYGVTKDYVKMMKVVLPQGDIVTLGNKCVKHVAGFNMEGIFVGSEGLLGIMTEVTLALLPIPEHRESALAIFTTLDSAAQAVADIIAAGVTPSTMEFMDNATINAIQNFKDCGLPRDAAAVLLIETDGDENAAKAEIAKVEIEVKKNNCREFARAKTSAERDTLFAGRRVALNALASVKPNLILEDATVMRSRLPEMVRGITDIATKYDIQVGIFGHAGDGNLHPTFLIDMQDKDEMARTEKAVAALFQLAIDLDGTISGEHGIGLEKKPFLQNQIGGEGIALLQNIKRTFDPLNLLNPGKMFDMPAEQAA
ncbi:FAD-binding oxidoreductase [Desulforhopalus sp. IMCC35007]|uniref:FAD-binding oxidoreductase n=1 Tax=Desulforhopalus sp. IMCC35007 TaxID=2569543 RepID=UPI0010ADDCEE|nr:FAD-linked oxidase C-terminal domain-containing protein [Desulforhopalus sp. IMCC35007]TKB07989.1 FAD-binding protein [Desulforhopalus sp. IMCC35007]